MIAFYDLEAELISRLSVALPEAYVSTEKPNKDYTPYPEKIVTVRTDGGYTVDKLIRREKIGVNIYAPTAAEAAALGLLVEATLINMADTIIKKVDIVLSTTRVKEETQAERRYLTAEVTVRAQEI